LTYRFTNEEDSKVMRNYRATACSACPLKEKCTTGRERRIKRTFPAKVAWSAIERGAELKFRECSCLVPFEPRGLPEWKFEVQELAGSTPPWFRNKGMRIATVSG
jgi:hypothetical protein